MGDWMMLVCAVLGALAAGVMVAYGVCLGFFAMFRMRAQQLVKEPVAQVRGTASVVGG